MSSIINETQEKMEKVIANLKKEFSAIRAGRANPALLDRVVIDYYGVPTPLNQAANISAPEPRLLTIQPWDKSMLGEIEKAIQRADLGLSPNNDGSIIRIPMPILTEERRHDLVKIAKKTAEEAKVVIRNARRDGNDTIKKSEKDSLISEDEAHKQQEDVQKLTDKFIKEIDDLLKDKEEDIMEV